MRLPDVTVRTVKRYFANGKGFASLPALCHYFAKRQINLEIAKEVDRLEKEFESDAFAVDFDFDRKLAARQVMLNRWKGDWRARSIEITALADAFLSFYRESPHKIMYCDTTDMKICRRKVSKEANP